MLRQILAAIVSLGLLLTPITASATRVSPMVVDLSPSGRGSTGRVVMINDAARDIPFEVLMMRGEISTDGKLEMVPADEDFLVFPTQVLVKSNSRQMFRVQYIGNPELAQSEIYYMSIKQIPVALETTEESTAQVQVLVNYNILVNIVPDGAKPEPVIRSITPATRVIGPIQEDEDEDGEGQDDASDTPTPGEAAPGESDAAPDKTTDGEAVATTAAQDEETEAQAEPSSEETSAEGESAFEQLERLGLGADAKAVLNQRKPRSNATSETAQAAIADVTPDKQPKTIKGIEVLLGNEGNRYFLAGLAEWKIAGKTTAGEDFSIQLEPRQIARFTGAGVVAPGKERRFFLPMITELDPATITIELELPAQEDS